MKQNKTSPLETLTEIRDLMERSSRFISLSGLSGVFAGLYALAGTYVAYMHLKLDGVGFLTDSAVINLNDPATQQFLFADAVVVLVLAVSTGIFLTTRKAARDGNSIFDSTAKKLLSNLSIPLITGGVFCLALSYHDALIFIAPATLIFYGLALIHASKYTRNDIRTLGVAQIALGLISTFIVGYGLLFWSLGFGVLHIVYGTYMYYKYEK